LYKSRSRDARAFFRIYRDLGSGLLRPVESPVPKCEGPGAPSSVVYKACGTGATHYKRAPHSCKLRLLC
jgi:hypothetical protein